jgi:hypothetical protein
MVAPPEGTLEGLLHTVGSDERSTTAVAPVLPYALVFLAGQALPPSWPRGAQLLLLVLLGVLSYPGALRFLRSDGYCELVALRKGA